MDFELERQRILGLKINVMLEMHTTGGIDIKMGSTDGMHTDLQYFKNITTQGPSMSNAVIMGRVTYETLDGPLTNRHNIIVSNTLNKISGCVVVKNLDAALLEAIKLPNVNNIWICGGKSIYDEFLARYMPDKIYLVVNHSKKEINFKTIMDYENIIPSGENFEYKKIENNDTYETDIDPYGENMHQRHLRLVREYNEYKLTIMHETDEHRYIKMIKNIICNGFYQLDRTKVGTLAVHGCTLRFNLRNGVLPVITSRRTFYRGAIEEFLWMLKGETDSSMLQNKNIHIWDGNTTTKFIKDRGLEGKVPENNIGALYGYQIRNWGGDWDAWINEHRRTGIDQLERLISGLKTTPNSRRHVISNYNVSQLEMGVLEPCHTLYTFNIDTDKREIHALLFMRSCDTCCGLVLNIIHISFLTHLLAKLLSTNDEEYTAGDFVFTGSNVHIYYNHLHSFIMQSYRKQHTFPKLFIHKNINSLQDIETLEYSDIEISNYKCNKPLKYEMAI